MAYGEILVAPALGAMIETMIAALFPDRIDGGLTVAPCAWNTRMAQQRRQGRRRFADKIRIGQHANAITLALRVVQPGRVIACKPGPQNINQKVCLAVGGQLPDPGGMVQLMPCCNAASFPSSMSQ